MMRNIHLHGALGDRYGHHFQLDVATAGEALRALNANFPGFAMAIKEGSWEIVRGRYDETGFGLDYDEVNGFKLGNGDLHIVPVVAGSKERGGFFKILIGAVLVGAAIFLSGGALAAPIGTGLIGGAITWGNVAAIGVSLMLAGVSKLLSPSDDPEEKAESYTLSGPGNNYAQGLPVPLVYGECIAGAQTISASLDIEDIAVTSASAGSGTPRRGND